MTLLTQVVMVVSITLKLFHILVCICWKEVSTGGCKIWKKIWLPYTINSCQTSSRMPWTDKWKTLQL